MGVELDILNAIHSISSPAMDSIMLGITYASTHAAVWLILAALLMFSQRYRKTGAAMIVAVAVSYIVCDLVLKPLICRERPCDLSGFELLVSIPDSYSFPSGHTMSSFAAATVLMISNRRLGIAAMAFAAMVGVSRLYLFVHWPTDVVAGALIGIVLAVLLLRFLYRYIPYFSENPNSVGDR